MYINSVTVLRRNISTTESTYLPLHFSTKKMLLFQVGPKWESYPKKLTIAIFEIATKIAQMEKTQTIPPRDTGKWPEMAALGRIAKSHESGFEG